MNFAAWKKIDRRLTRISADQTKQKKNRRVDIASSPPLNPLPVGGEVKRLSPPSEAQPAQVINLRYNDGFRCLLNQATTRFWTSS